MSILLFRNLVSLSKLDTTGYVFKFENKCFSLFKHNCLIGYGVLCDVLYKLKLDNIFAETLLFIMLVVSVVRMMKV